jgi:folate-binding protein YgfZ
MIRVKAEVTRASLFAAVSLHGDGSDVAASNASGGVVGWWGRGTVLLGESSSLPAGAADAGSAGLSAARVAAGWPAMGAEILPGERVPAEIGVVAVAVNLRKGCYPGQELVERMDSRGAQAPRRLCQLDVEAGASAGDPIVVDGAEVGLLTSVAGPLALGYVKRGVDHGRPVADLAKSAKSAASSARSAPSPDPPHPPPPADTTSRPNAT